MKNLQNSAGLIFTLTMVTLSPAIYAQPTGRPSPMISKAIDETKLVTLEGNTRPEATAANDRGVVSDSLALEHMFLQLKRSPEREAALATYIDELHDATSPNYHQWLTPEQFSESYGVAKADVDTVTSWLKSHGFSVNGVQPSGLMIDFSGTAGQVRAAYHTEIHNLEVKGEKHFANMSDPKIPAALEPAVVGIVSLHNFHPRPLLVPRGQYTFTGTFGVQHALVPGDIATIYNLNPVFKAGYTGKGQTIMVVEDTYVYSTTDFTTFRSTYGLSTSYPSGSLTQISPTGVLACTNPGFQGSPGDPGYGDDGEAAIDVEWASAAAPNASIVLAACTDTTTTFGGLIALANVLYGKKLPSVVSISYGEAEAYNGAAMNATYEKVYQQGAAEGVSIFVSSGDEDGASADETSVSTHGIGVSAFTSTPYNVSVGGLDLAYTALGANPSAYWSSTNGVDYNSALSYIPEIPWNDSCAGELAANFFGLTRTGFCNSATGAGFLESIGGSGGPSGCATGTPSTPGVVSGTCAGYAKPTWQSGLFGNPSDGVRDIPDVALFASNGFWDAYYVVCWSDPNTAIGGGYSCTGAPSTWAGFGGTSVSSPIMAGIQALVDEKTGSLQGNPNPIYYGLAKEEYGASGTTACKSLTVNKTSNGCVFYDVTAGDNTAVCEAASGGVLNNCAIPSGDTYGILDTGTAPAFVTNLGWDFPTGIGSVNAYNLVMNWPATAPTSSGE
jgi:subtilase family serine protease